MTRVGTAFLLITAFFEGGAVMTTEIIGAKMLAPYYGNSLFVWAGALGITLAGLAGGYFAGSACAKLKNTKLNLFTALSAGAIAMALMPVITSTIVNATLSFELRVGIIVSCLALLLIPLFCFGMVTPLVIACIAFSSNNAGRATGNVYAISTVGGILFTFITGFYLIPQLGLKASTYLVASIITIFPVIYFLTRIFQIRKDR